MNKKNIHAFHLSLVEREQNRESEAERASENARLRTAGRRTAASLKPAQVHRVSSKLLEHRTVKAGAAIDALVTARPTASKPPSLWVIDNLRLIRTAQKEARTLVKGNKTQPAVSDESGATVPRVYSIAEAYVEASSAVFNEDTVGAFITGFQETIELEMGEVWALRPALQLALLERVAAEGHTDSPRLSSALISLRRLGEGDWKSIFESLNIIDGILAVDPAQAYSAMDFASRDLYRNVIAEVAKHSGHTERDVAQAAIEMAEQARREHREGPAAERRMHVGYYLIDNGLASLRKQIGHKAPLLARLRDLIVDGGEYYYIIGIEVATFAIIALLLNNLSTLTPIVAAFFLLILPATQAAVDFINNLTTRLIGPRILPKLDFSDGIPESCATMVAVPTLLLSEQGVRELVTDLEIRFLANRDPNIYFALLTDSPDSLIPIDERDQLVDICQEAITQLNQRYGRRGKGPFYMFHRHRVFNESEGRWMGWERKRGKLIDLNQLLRGGFDSFPVKVGDLSILPRIKYVITLDSDTQLPRDTAHRLVGAMAHPLNRPVIDPRRNIVVEGYGILQPRIGISIQSASRSRLASLYSGQTGFDIYTHAVSDVYQDLFGEGIFTGKGIYDVDALRQVLEHRFPDNTLLSHDLIEGAYARAGLVSDIELIDDYPSHFSAYSRRKHRWVRGDWQIMKWLFNRVPDYQGRKVMNPISLISQWKIGDNLRRSLFEPATLALLIAGWLWLPGGAAFWTLATVAMLLIPVYSGLFFSLAFAPFRSPVFGAWLRDVFASFIRGHVTALIQMVFLLHQAMLAIDAIWRSLARLLITKKRLLEWETAAEAEAERRKRSTVDIYLELSPYLAALIASIVGLVKPQALTVAAPWLVLWFTARWISALLNREPRAADRRLATPSVRWLRASALRTWRYFREFSDERNNWLIPDNIHEDGTTISRLSPTNVGFLLNARIAAVQFGYLTLPEFVSETLKTLETVDELPKFRGHMLNWYDAETLEVLNPRFVSTVDSGNLAACLWTLKQAASTWIEKPPAEDALRHGLSDFANVIAASGGPGAAVLQHGILKTESDWKAALLEIETLSRSYAETATTDAVWWASELVNRVEAIRAWFAEPSVPEINAGLQRIVEIAGRLVEDMDFGFLYHRRKKVLSVGYDIDAQRLEPSSYDLLASESRVSAFIAIAKGNVPQESWFHLGRKHILYGGNRVLMSWTGTMFEYLMPALWMRHYRHTIIHQSIEAAVRVHREAVRQYDTPWGISESSYVEDPESTEYAYAAFGIPELAMKRMTGDTLVISPYSAFLALAVDPRAAIDNLKEMEKLGWIGTYGFYEAVDYRSGKPRLLRSWMAHHQGMSLLAICNLLTGNALQNYFHTEPHVLATELLLHERVPKAIVIEAEEMPPIAAAASSAA